MNVVLLVQFKKMDQMDQMQKSHYQKACIVICGDVMEDWKYIFRELRMRVGVSHVSNTKAVATTSESPLN